MKITSSEKNLIIKNRIKEILDPLNVSYTLKFTRSGLILKLKSKYSEIEHKVTNFGIDGFLKGLKMEVNLWLNRKGSI